MKEVPLSPELSAAVHTHSMRYVAFLRDLVTPISFRVLSAENKKKIMTEVPIISERDLPADHPRREAPKKGMSGEKFDEALNLLRRTESGSSSQVLSAVKFILSSHKNWYTEEGKALIRRLCRDYPFTSQQRAQIPSR